MLKAVILTISDTRDLVNDLSGKIIKERLLKEEYELSGYEIIKDDIEQIRDRLQYFATVKKVDLILTNGGTGLSPRDVTPEATRLIIDKEVPGIPEMMRLEGLRKTKRAVLSRGIAGVKSNTLIINLPGSPKGANESLEIVLDLIPHALEMLKGKDINNNHVLYYPRKSNVGR